MPRPNPKDQARAARKAALRAGQAHVRRRGIYVLLAVILIAVIAVGVGWYLYVSGQSGACPSQTQYEGPISGTVYAKICTSQGVIEVELYQSDTPITVTNFVTLARSGFYDNLVWHRIVKGFVVQTGDPNTRSGGGDRSTWGNGGSPQTIPLEINSTLHNDVGYLGMARSNDPHSGSSQFYINLANNNSLDGNYTVFGRVINGMSVAYALGNVSVNSQSQPVDASQAMMTKVIVTNAP